MGSNETLCSGFCIEFLLAPPTSMECNSALKADIEMEFFWTFVVWHCAITDIQPSRSPLKDVSTDISQIQRRI